MVTVVKLILLYRRECYGYEIKSGLFELWEMVVEVTVKFEERTATKEIDATR